MIGEGIREWALTVCAASVFCAAVSIFVPGEKYERVINLSLTALMLLILVSPLRGLRLPEIEISPAEQEAAEVQSMEALINAQAAERMAAAAELVLEQMLNERGIYLSEISVSMDISETGCISIGHVTTRLDRDCRAAPAEVSRLLADWTGAVSVEVTGGTDG